MNARASSTATGSRASADPAPPSSRPPGRRRASTAGSRRRCTCGVGTVDGEAEIVRARPPRRRSRRYGSTPPTYGRNTRGLPGTFAPMYHEFADGISVRSANSLTCCTHLATAVGVGSMVVFPASRRSTRQSATHSTCCSIDTAMFDSTDGLPGPVIMKKFGNPTDIRPRYVSGPAAHRSASVTPSRPVMSTETMAPVIASNPVAYTMASNSRLSHARVDPGLGDRGDRRLAQIDETDVGQVERLVVVGVETRALGVDVVVLRAQRLGGLRIVARSSGSCRGRTRRPSRWPRHWTGRR